MSNRALKIYKNVRSAAPNLHVQPDQSGWTARLGYSLYEAVERTLSSTDADQKRYQFILTHVGPYINYVARTNDLFVGHKDGHTAAVSFRKTSNPGNKGEAKIAVLTPENRIVFAAASGAQSRKFQGFDDVNRGFNYWWWKKEVPHWLGDLNAAPEVNSVGNARRFYNSNPRVILPGEFWEHVAHLPKTIVELLADATSRVYYANRHTPEVHSPNWQNGDRKRYRKKVYSDLVERLQPELQRALDMELSVWQHDVQLHSPSARLQAKLYPHSYGVVRYFSECDREVAGRRALFAQTFPFMMPMLARSAWFLNDRKKETPARTRTLISQYCRKWRDVVDSGGKFVSVAAADFSEHTGVPIIPALVKRFAGISAELSTDDNVVLVIEQLQQLAALPIQYIPAEGADFIRFSSGVARCVPLLDVVGQDMGTVVKHAGKNLTSDMAKIGALSKAPGHLKDYIEAIFGKIILAWAARHAAQQGKELDVSFAKSCSELDKDSLLKRVMRSRSEVGPVGWTGIGRT